MISHCYKIIDADAIRNNLYNTLVSITNDNLMSEYIVLFLTSQILGRVSGLLLGKVSLNIRLADSDLVQRLNNFISNIVHYALHIDININNMIYTSSLLMFHHVKHSFSITNT